MESTKFHHNPLQFIEILRHTPFCLSFDNRPEVFNGVKVRTVRRPIHDFWDIFLKKILSHATSMFRIETSTFPPAFCLLLGDVFLLFQHRVTIHYASKTEKTSLSFDTKSSPS